MKRILFFILICISTIPGFAITHKDSSSPKEDLIKVLILSGKNNHEWQKTTPMLVRIFKESKRFTITVSDIPDTLTYSTLKKFQLVISNWNTWPDNKIRMNSQWERDFLRYVNEGGGVLSIHAGASSFYDWEPYHRIGIGRWGKETRHGPRTRGHIYNLDQSHPITMGMGSFYLMDEIWENTDIYPGSKAIGSLTAKDEKDGHLIDVSSIFVSQNGKGRCFFTTLGHDERALLNSGLQTLLLRAGQWCAGKEVTIEIAGDLKNSAKTPKDQLSWCKTDTTLALMNHSDIIWQFNGQNRFGKPYFHPLTVNQSDLTCVSPPDHPWHVGLWFSWKFINGVNYWEYQKNFSSTETGFKSDGITAIKNQKFSTNSDFSADVHLNLTYHPVDGNAVMSEERLYHISKPSSDGSYYIDEEHLFIALSDSVLLDRTPITGEPGGQSWGGYSGLSIRFNQSFTSPEIVSPGDSASRRKSAWIYMGFQTLKDAKAGMLILNHPRFTPKSSSWYIINDSQVPFYYYSPAVIFDKNILLKKGESLHLKYRIWMLGGEVSKGQLQQKYNQCLDLIK